MFYSNVYVFAYGQDIIENNLDENIQKIAEIAVLAIA